MKDFLNRSKKRTIKNTPKEIYNCGGYALKTFSWYCPYPSNLKKLAIEMFHRKKPLVKEEMQIFIDHMLEDFPERLRLIQKEEEKRENERIVLFRIGGGDFHYVIGEKNHWYHKRGSFWQIERMGRKEVFSEAWKNRQGTPRYNSEIIMFALLK